MQQHSSMQPAANTPGMLSHAPLDLQEAEALCNSLKRIAVRSENALHKGDAADGITKVEHWLESYRRGLAAAEKISHSGVELLQHTRNQLALTLSERHRMMDEGGPSQTTDQITESDELTDALRRIDQLLHVLEASFTPTESPTT